MLKDEIYQRFKDGYWKVFSINDFLDLGDRGVIQTILSELSSEKIIFRLIENENFYAKLQQNLFLKQLVTSVSTHDIAKKLALDNGYYFTYTEATSLNKVGLSTQVQAKLVFCWTGKNQSFQYKNSIIQFQHIDEVFVKDISLECSILLQAIKGGLRYGLTKKDLNILALFYNKHVKDNILDKEFQIRFEQNYPELWEKLILINEKVKNEYQE